MDGLSHKLSRGGLYLLLLTGPILGLATKGFAPLLAIAGTLAVIGHVLQAERLKASVWKAFLPFAPFFIFAMTTEMDNRVLNRSCSFSDSFVNANQRLTVKTRTDTNMPKD